MTLSKFMTASLLGVMSLSSGALAKRHLTQQEASQEICKRNPSLPFCTELPAPSVEPEVTDSDIEVDAADSADATVAEDTSPPPPTASGHPPAPSGSSAKCYAVAIGGGSSGGNTVAEAAVEVAAYVCGGEGYASVEAAAEATATLFAQAVAQASVYCEGSGDTKLYAEAHAKAVETAEGWLKAYAEAFASASVCGVCDAYAESWGYVEKYVFLKAVAEASAKLEAYTNAQSLPVFMGYVNDYQITVKEAVATAYASALADAASYKDGAQCFAWVNTNGCIYTPDHPDPEYCDGGVFSCTAQSVSYSIITEIDAVATASANAGTYTCADHVVLEAETHVVATDLAEATAIAVSEVYISCKASDGAYACAEGGTYITDTAYAVAKAFAEAWASTYTCKGTCIVDAVTVTEAVGSVLATACSSAYEHLCAVDGEHWVVFDWQQYIETNYLVAIAEAWAYAFYSNPPETCIAAVGVSADTIPVP